eukprot:COSAG02_NODE_12642_length_1515_cov_3.079096_1_plen_201_part_00
MLRSRTRAWCGRVRRSSSGLTHHAGQDEVDPGLQDAMELGEPLEHHRLAMAHHDDTALEQAEHRQPDQPEDHHPPLHHQPKTGRPLSPPPQSTVWERRLPEQCLPTGGVGNTHWEIQGTAVDPVRRLVFGGGSYLKLGVFGVAVVDSCEWVIDVSGMELCVLTDHQTLHVRSSSCEQACQAGGLDSCHLVEYTYIEITEE